MTPNPRPPTFDRAGYAIAAMVQESPGGDEVVLASPDRCRFCGTSDPTAGAQP